MFFLKRTIFFLTLVFAVPAFSDSLDEINFLFSAGRYDEASTVIEKEIEKGNYSVYLLIDRISVNANLEKCVIVLDTMDMLKNKYGTLIQKDPSFFDIYNGALKLSAICAIQLKDYEKTVSYLREVIPRLNKDDEYLQEFRFRLANYCILLNDYDCSREQYILFYSGSCIGKVDEEMISWCESTEYNMAIFEGKLGNMKESTKWARQLLDKTNNRKYWYEKMIQDPDYVNILKILKRENISK